MLKSWNRLKDGHPKRLLCRRGYGIMPAPMTADDVYPNSPLQGVVFEIRFPGRGALAIPLPLAKRSSVS